MELKTPYAFGRTVDISYAEAEQRVREELAKEGFGVLTDRCQKEVRGKAPEGFPRVYHPRRLQSAARL